MNNIISSITSAESPILVVILALVLTFIFIKEIYAAIKWIKDRFDGYHNIKNDEEDKEETIEERISVLEKHDKWQFNKLNELGDEIKEVIAMIKKVQDTQTKAIVSTYRSELFRIYHDNIKQGYISQTELDRFISLVDQYRKAGGDGIIDEKIYPEIINLPIKSE